MSLTSRTAGGQPRSSHGGRLPRTARRLQLLDAAQQVFVAAGYHATVMDEIAVRAGVSKPVLYQHFPGKLELYLALLDRHCGGLADSVHAALASTSDNKLRVQATVSAYFEFVAREGAPFRLVFESDLTNEASVRERLERVTLTCADAIAQVIAEDTDLPADQAHLLGVGLTGMAQVCARYWLVQGSSIPRDEAARLVGALAWRGLGGFPKIERAGGGEGIAPAGG